MLIEQTPEEAKSAMAFNRNAELASIRLVRMKASSQTVAEEVSGRLMVGFSHRSRSIDAPPGLVRVEILFRMVGMQKANDGTGPDDKQLPVVSVECCFQADYKLEEGYEPQPDELKAFKDGNAIFNCWPYFREQLQNTLVRMNFPPLTAPFLRLTPKKKRQLEAEQDHSTQAPTTLVGEK